MRRQRGRSRIGGYPAALSLDFLNAPQSAASVLTFTRASTGTYFDTNGVMQTAGNNVPRFDFNPATLQPRGLLIEGQAQNLPTYARQFDNAVWTKSAASVAADVASAPDGTTTADKLVEDTSNAIHNIRQGVAAAVTSGVAHAGSVLVQASGRDKVRLVMESSGTIGVADYDLIAGTASLVSGTGASLVALGGGWWRPILIAPTNTAGAALNIRTATGAGQSYQGDGSSGLYLWNAQIEQGDFATSAILTAAAAATRSADVATLALSNVPGWSASEGTIYVEFDLFGLRASGDQNVVTLDDGGSANRVGVRVDTGTIQSLVLNGGAGAVLSHGAAAVNTTYRAALAWAPNSVVSVVNGGAPQTSSSYTVPTFSTLRIGAQAAGGQLHGHIRRLRLYGKRQPDAVLQGMTA